MAKAKVFRRSVALEPSDIKQVKSLASLKGLNFSSALRVIIREWSELKGGDRILLTEKGRQALDEHRNGEQWES